ncbi:MAG: RecB family exonuclease, partial [archaeon]
MEKGMFDSSSIKQFISCQRKYYWRYVKNLRLKEKEPAPLNFGTAIHEALRIWYEEHNMDKAIEIFHEIWDERFKDKKRTHEKGEKILRQYAETYPTEPFTWVSDPEEVFEIDLFGNRFVGRFDGVIDFQGDVYVIDHKTASRMGSSYFTRYRPDLQMTAYTWAARQLYPDKDVKGVLLNILYFTTRKIEFHRNITERQQFEIDEFLSLALNAMENIKARDRDDYKDWLPNWDHCVRWGTCQFRDLCT